MSEVSLFLRKSASYFWLIDFLLHFKLDPDANPVPEPETGPKPEL